MLEQIGYSERLEPFENEMCHNVSIHSDRIDFLDEKEPFLK